MVATAGAVFALTPSLPAAAALVTNGGFETGDFTGWTRTGAVRFVGVDDTLPNSGDFAAAFSPNLDSTISQSISTFAGQSYRITLFLAHEAPGAATPVNAFKYSFGGVEIGSFANFAQRDYAPIIVDRVGTGAPMTLSFTFKDTRPSRFFIDDISVVRLARINGVLTPLPEPATWFSMLLGFALTGLVMRRRQSRPLSA